MTRRSAKGGAPKPAEPEPTLGLSELLDARLIVPIRSSSGSSPDPLDLGIDAVRHGTDESGARFLGAFTSLATFDKLGPPGSDYIVVLGRDLIERADYAQERLVIDPGGPGQLEVAIGVLPFLAAGIDPSHPDALRALRPLGALPALEAPDHVPEPFGRELRRALEELPQVARAWLLRTPNAWTAGIQMIPDAELGEFDAVRNRLLAIAAEHLGSRQALAVTDLRAPALRERYDAEAMPFYIARRSRRGLLSRIFGG